MKKLAKILAFLALAAGAAALVAALWPPRESADDYIVLERYGNA